MKTKIFFATTFALLLSLGICASAKTELKFFVEEHNRTRQPDSVSVRLFNADHVMVDSMWWGIPEFTNEYGLRDRGSLQFRLTAPTKGDYTITVSAPGYLPATIPVKVPGRKKELFLPPLKIGEKIVKEPSTLKKEEESDDDPKTFFI